MLSVVGCSPLRGCRVLSARLPRARLFPSVHEAEICASRHAVVGCVFVFNPPHLPVLIHHLAAVSALFVSVYLCPVDGSWELLAS